MNCSAIGCDRQSARSRNGVILWKCRRHLTLCAVGGCQNKRARSRNGFQYTKCREHYNDYQRSYRQPTESFLIEQVGALLARIEPELRSRVLAKLLDASVIAACATT